MIPSLLAKPKVLYFTLNGWPDKGCEGCPDLKLYDDRVDH